MAKLSGLFRSPFLYPLGLVVLAVPLVGIILTADELNPTIDLLSAATGGLIVAAAVLYAEGRSRRALEQQRRIQANLERQQVLQTLTAHMGGELVNLPALVGLDIDVIERPKGLQELWTAIHRHSDDPSANLTLNAWDCVERFYQRLGDLFDTTLGSLLNARDQQALDCLLDTWGLRRTHQIRSRFLWKKGTAPGWIQNVVEDPAPRAAYLMDTARILESYSELLRVAQGLESGRPSRQQRS